MRQIEFRGKRIDNGEWVYGNLIIAYYTKENKLSECKTIIKLQDAFKSELMEFYVDSSTVGQFTGLTDKNGRKIFEGDIVYCYDHPTNIESCSGDVFYENGGYRIRNSCLRLDDHEIGWIEIIENIH